MIRNSVIIILLAAAALWAALGSGPFVRTGVGIGGLFGTELELKSEGRYFLLIDNPLNSRNKESQNVIFAIPAFVIGYEHSFALPLSVSSGLGLGVTGLAWREIDSYYIDLHNNSSHLINRKIDGRLKLTYITLPVEVKLMLPLNSGGFCVTLGPNFAYLASAKFENRVESRVYNERDFYKPFTIGIGGSIGGEVYLFKELDLLYALRIESGLMDIAKTDDIELRKFAISLEFGLRWTIDRHPKSKKWPL